MLRSLLAPEAQLLFLCCGGPENDAAIRDLLERDLDVGALGLLARREHAAPALLRRLDGMGSDGAVPARIAELGRLARVITFKMSYLQRRLAETVEALDRAGIKCVMLKGAALATRVYGSFVERPMTDLDLLVRADQAQEAVRVLLTAGWLWRSDRAQDDNFDHLHHLPALLDARGMEVSLELHTALLPPGQPFGLFAEDVLASAVSVASTMPGGWIPEPRHLLLHTCIHFAWGHLFRKGAWNAFRDVQAATRALDVNWPAFIELANASRARTCCYWTFRLARDLMGVQIPEGVMAALRPPLPEFVLERLARHFTLILFPSADGCPSIRLRRFMWRAGIMPQWSGHGTVRPWDLLTLLPEHRASRGLPPVPERRGLAQRLAPQNGWLQYCRNVLLEGQTPRSSIS